MKVRTVYLLVTALIWVQPLSLFAQHDDVHLHDEHGDAEMVVEEVDPSQLSGVRLYDWLGYEGYYSDYFSDEELRNFVSRGLASDEPDILHSTIGSLAWYAVHTLTQRDEAGNPIFDRGLTSVSGLKQKLIEVWRSNKSPENYPLTTEDVEMSIESSKGRPVIVLDYVWSYIPPTLAALYPKDPEVHTVLWDGYDPDNPISMLDWLNRGQFTTTEATKLRLNSLDSQEESKAVLAAVGLALTNTEEALTALVDRLEMDRGNRVVRAYLIDSIATFGIRATQHLELLRQAADEADLLPPKGSTLVRPEGYGLGTQIGIEYRTQEALRNLEALLEQPMQAD